MTVAEKFGQNLALARKRTGQSQEALAFRAGLHRTEIGLLERGERTPRIDTLVKLAAALCVEPGTLLDGIVWTPPEMEHGGFTLPPELPCDDA